MPNNVGVNNNVDITAVVSPTNTSNALVSQTENDMRNNARTQRKTAEVQVPYSSTELPMVPLVHAAVGEQTVITVGKEQASVKAAGNAVIVVNITTGNATVEPHRPSENITYYNPMSMITNTNDSMEGIKRDVSSTTVLNDEYHKSQSDDGNSITDTSYQSGILFDKIGPKRISRESVQTIEKDTVPKVSLSSDKRNNIEVSNIDEIAKTIDKEELQKLEESKLTKNEEIQKVDDGLVSDVKGKDIENNVTESKCEQIIKDISPMNDLKNVNNGFKNDENEKSKNTVNDLTGNKNECSTGETVLESAEEGVKPKMIAKIDIVNDDNKGKLMEQTVIASNGDNKNLNVVDKCGENTMDKTKNLFENEKIDVDINDKKDLSSTTVDKKTQKKLESRNGDEDLAKNEEKFENIDEKSNGKVKVTAKRSSPRIKTKVPVSRPMMSAMRNGDGIFDPDFSPRRPTKSPKKTVRYKVPLFDPDLPVKVASPATRKYDPDFSDYDFFK